MFCTSYGQVPEVQPYIYGIKSAVAVIVAVLIEMSLDALVDWRTIVIAVVTVVSTVTAFVFKKVNSAFIVLGASLF